MGKPGWTNLSIHTADYDRVRRMFDTEIKTDRSWSDWLIDTLLSSLERKKFLKTKYPHLRFVGNTETGCVIEDTKTKKIITVTFDGRKLVSNEKDTQYVIFASLTPDLRLG